MKRWTDRLAHAAVLALAGYAVRQLVSDVKAMRYVDAVLERGGLPRSPARVLSWDEAIQLHTTEVVSHPSFRGPPPAPMANAMMTRPRDWTPRQASLIFTANEIARDAELVARVRARQAQRARRW